MSLITEGGSDPSHVYIKISISLSAQFNCLVVSNRGCIEHISCQHLHHHKNNRYHQYFNIIIIITLSSKTISIIIVHNNDYFDYHLFSQLQQELCRLYSVPVPQVTQRPLFEISSISVNIHSSLMFYDVLWCSMIS